MANILKNPDLKGFTLVRYFTDKSGNVGAIENPDNWEYVYTPLNPEDPELIPQSLHRDKGYCIAAGYRKWEAGYVQRGVQLRKGQRYLAKAVFTPDVNFAPGQPADPTAIQWQFWVEGGGDKIGSGWRSTGKGYKQEEETLFVIEATSDVNIDLYFKMKSEYAGNVCDFNLHKVTLEEVPADYGGPDAARIGAGGVGASSFTAPASQPAVSAVLPTSPGPSSDLPLGRAEVLTSSLGEVITNDDIDVITAGLRAMSQVTPNAAVVAGFLRLADVLERLRK
jgi:hypothetical protein